MRLSSFFRIVHGRRPLLFLVSKHKNQFYFPAVDIIDEGSIAKVNAMLQATQNTQLYNEWNVNRSNERIKCDPNIVGGRHTYMENSFAWVLRISKNKSFPNAL